MGTTEDVYAKLENIKGKIKNKESRINNIKKLKWWLC